MGERALLRSHRSRLKTQGRKFFGSFFFFRPRREREAGRFPFFLFLPFFPLERPQKA